MSAGTAESEGVRGQLSVSLAIPQPDRRRAAPVEPSQSDEFMTIHSPFEFFFNKIGVGCSFVLCSMKSLR